MFDMACPEFIPDVKHHVIVFYISDLASFRKLVL